MPGPGSLPVVLLGTGGNARVLLHILRGEGAEVVGCVALARPDPATWPSEVPYLGDDEALRDRDPDAVVLVNGVGSAGPIEHRRRAFENAREAGFRFRGVRHAKATVDPSAQIHETALIMAGAIVQCGARIGENVLINTGAIVDHDGRIGAHSHVATGARLAGEVIIEDSVHIGAGATIIQRGTVGRGAVVAAGAVVIRPIEPGTVHAGVPARPLRQRSS